VRVTAMEYGLVAALIASAVFAVGVVANQFPTHVAPIHDLVVHPHYELHGEAGTHAVSPGGYIDVA
jgi:hypothetical protein